MDILKNRPLATVLFSFSLMTVIVSITCGKSAKLILALLLLLLSVLSVILPKLSMRLRVTLPRMKRYVFTSVMLALTAGTLLSSVAFDLLPSNVTSRAGSDAFIEGEICEVSYSSSYLTIATVKIKLIDGEKCNAKVKLIYNGDADIESGDSFACASVISSLDREDYGFDEYLYCRASGIVAEAEVKDDIAVTKEHEGIGFFPRLRERLASRIDRGKSDGGALIRAMLLGDRTNLNSHIALAFRRAGISHLLALSGLHLSIISGALLMLLKLLHIPMRARCALCSALVVFYVMLVGAPLSVVRSAIMLLVLFASFIFSREADGLTSLSLAAALIIIFSPSAVFDMGFYLSFSATFAILVANTLKRRRTVRAGSIRRMLRKVLDALLISLAAIAGTLPISAALFGEISLIAPLSNLIFMLPAEVLLIISLPAVLLPSVKPLSTLALSLAELMCDAVGRISSIHEVLFPISSDIAIALIFVFYAVFIVMLVTKKASFKLISAVACTAGLAFILGVGISYAARRGVADITLASSGDDDVIMVRCDSTSVLIDATSGAYSSVKDVPDEFAKISATEIDCLVLTHYHRKQSQTLARLSGRIKVFCLLLPVPITEEEESMMSSVIATAEKYGIEYSIYDPLVPSEIGSVTYTALPHGYITRSTHPVIGFTVTAKENSVSYIGESYSDSDYSAFAAGCVSESEALILGGHGPVADEPFPYTRYADSALMIFCAGSDTALSAKAHSGADERNVTYLRSSGKVNLSFSRRNVDFQQIKTYN